MGWGDDKSIHESGRLLARFHDGSLATRARAQRPGALPLRLCRPSRADAPVAEIERELAEIGYDAELQTVVHGDATNSNVVVDAGVYRFVDFALAYKEALTADIGFALWRNGRADSDAITYDAARVAQLVRGYASLRPLRSASARAIVVYMKGRGLQLQHRLELRHGSDETIMQRLNSIQRQQLELERAIATALSSA